MIIVTPSVSKSFAFKYFPSTLHEKRKTAIFKFLRFEEHFRKAASCWTETSVQLRLMRESFQMQMTIANHFLMIFPRTSLHFKLVPVQYREYEYGLLTFITLTFSRRDFFNPDHVNSKSFGHNLRVYLALKFQSAVSLCDVRQNN